MILAWIRFGVAALLIAAGLAVQTAAVLGVFKFKFVLNRMHVAALGDTLGLMLVLLGLIVIRGAEIASLKLAAVIVFFWIASPVSSHLISRLEVTTDRDAEKRFSRREEK